MEAEELVRRHGSGERDFGLANLSGTALSGANLAEISLSGADLSQADLSGANLRQADLQGPTCSKPT